MKPHFRLDTHPVADAANVVQGEHYRITVLDAGLVRLEYSPTGEFEDRASQMVLDRAFPPCDFTLTRGDGPDGQLEISTDRLHLTYDCGEFTTHGLSVRAKGGFHSNDSVWRYGVASPNLGGTARTLDDVDGPIELEDGVLAYNGVAMVDDSSTVLLTDDGWIAPRRNGNLDLYVFAFGRDFTRALEVLYTLTGPTPVLPRYALGNWW
ncbi:glycoside hydrolase, partial [Salmonella enterica]|nr:glycoside hydrolase [Salmonella enterica]